MQTIIVYSTTEETTTELNIETTTVKTIKETVPNVTAVTTRDEIRNCSRLFYELTSWRYFGIYRGGNEVVRTNKFKEVTNKEDFVERDNRLDDIEYINHHNFKYIK